MKTSKIMLMPLLICFTISLSAFWSPAGGEGFEIFLDNKLVMQKFNRDMKQSSTFSLKSTNAKSKLSVQFYHCGMAGKERVLMLKDAQMKLLKQWTFRNTEAKNFSISIPIAELQQLQQKTGNAKAYLYYASKETGGARLLTGITF
ncbi:MAG TPA: hypothetical protein PKU77_05635 [Ferruginibacter sp.]|nr:hypothetical protein [Ferruginibacter sp.]